MAFPIHRPRRLRRTDALRRMVRETELRPSDFIYPLFVVEGRGVRQARPVDAGRLQPLGGYAVEEAKRAASLGIPLGHPLRHPRPQGRRAAPARGPRTASSSRRSAATQRLRCRTLQLIADVCFCEYTDHGHCGVVEHGGRRGQRRDAAPAGPAWRQPRQRGRRHRGALGHDGRQGGRHPHARSTRRASPTSPILSYAAKYASGFYGPFREAAQSAPQFGDRRGYQMDPGNVREALKEVALDLEEGADMVMVKPALAYLDVIRRVKERFDVPVAAYNVSGEYAMVKAAGRERLDRRAAGDDGDPHHHQARRAPT